MNNTKERHGTFEIPSFFEIQPESPKERPTFFFFFKTSRALLLFYLGKFLLGGDCE
jgi:hypothetical protein